MQKECDGLTAVKAGVILNEKQKDDFCKRHGVKPIACRWVTNEKPESEEGVRARVVVPLSCPLWTRSSLHFPPFLAFVSLPWLSFRHPRSGLDIPSSWHSSWSFRPSWYLSSPSLSFCLSLSSPPPSPRVARLPWGSKVICAAQFAMGIQCDLLLSLHGSIVIDCL